MKSSTKDNDYNDWSLYFEENNFNIFNQAVRLKVPIEAIIENSRRNSRILEVGCGSGFTSILLSKLGYDVTATDVDSDVVRYVSFKKKDFNSDLKPLRMDMLHICFMAKEFDVVFHQGLLEHFDDKTIVAALKEQGRVAKFVIFDVPNSRYKLGPNNKGDERLLSVKYWQRLINLAGLHIVKVYGRGLNLAASFLPYGLVHHLSNQLSTSTIFVCKQFGE